MLTEECIQNLVTAISVVENRAQALLTGQITIGDLRSAVDNTDKFAELAEIILSEKNHNAAFIKKAIATRQKELCEFQEQSKRMAIVSSLCTHLANVDRKCIDDALQKLEKIETHSIVEFCLPVDVKQIKDLSTYCPTVHAFKESAQVVDMALGLQRCYMSSTFMVIWNSRCQEVFAQCPTLDDVVIKVWIPVKNRWDQVSDKIKTGEIKFRDFEKILGQRYKDDYRNMLAEMLSMNVPEKIIQKRIDQLKQYRQLENCVKGAKTMLKFSQQFRLTGDFNQIRVIANHGENNQTMKSFDSNVMKACEFLKDLTPAKENCLKTFVSCEPLVRWLKDSMKESGLKELKVFVDLAFMSAGDEPINIARVQCLHSAVTGFAPLIFDLKETCGYKELLQLCSNVWIDLEANPNLPDQLKDTNRQLPWLKDIEKAHGSVEVTSLMQAETINGFGIYTVGRNAWKKELMQNQVSNSDQEDVAGKIQLTVPEKDGKRLIRNYNFSQLQDLQSRLMLVAGKGDKSTASVDRFTMIFDSITRLGNVYVKLCSSGCVLFKDFTARFICDPSPNRPVCVILYFGQGDGSPQLKGRRSHDEDLKDMIPKLASFMETCLDQWLLHFKDKRKSYLHLNYFTVDQLVILQRELVKMGTQEEPSHLIYPLLSAVKENCTPGDVMEAMAAAKDEIEGAIVIETETQDTEVKDNSDIATHITLDEKKKHFVQELVKVGYDECLAMKALEFVNPEEVTEGIVWCMDHETTIANNVNDQPSVAKDGDGFIRKQMPEKPKFTGWSDSQTDIQTLISTNISGVKKLEGVGVTTFIDELKSLWTMFLESISSNIRDYLSLEHLGVILKYLAQKSTQHIARSLPLSFQEGEPNLIICPSADVLMTTLSVYMDKDQPLPQSDEILMCTPNTSRDEIDIFWRRAIFDGGTKIHCLVNADLLDYDISEAAERLLEEYLLEIHYTGLKYRLLIICGSDNEYRSGLVSSLDKYKRQTMPTNISHLRDYLARNLIVQQETVDRIRPAACVDTNRSSVRVIKSWRAGVGKTLFKMRREDQLSGLNRTIRSKTVSIPLQEKNIDLQYVTFRLLEHTFKPGDVAARIFHIDISHEVQTGVEYLLFNLLILGCLVDKSGFVWRKNLTDLYLIETMPLMMKATNRRAGELQYVHPLLGLLPDVICRSPQESLHIYQGNRPTDIKQFGQLFDDKEFRSPVFQRAFQYLSRLDQGRALGDVNPRTVEGTQQTCLLTLLKHCGLKDPSWAELHHFVWFLNTQLVDFEQNSFVSVAAAEDLPGFTKFVLQFLITMSKDFATRSLNISEESPCVYANVTEAKMIINGLERDESEEEIGDSDLQTFQLRRTWESSPHPYLFFNSDRFTFTFLGFFIDRASGNLIDTQTRTVLERGIMAQNLYDSLVRNHAPMQENFDVLPRDQKIIKLCKVMGIDFPHDPDDTYELTTDNVKKIMAIYMRFRCDIPVIIMGETGCGKTRLIKFMCALQSPPGVPVTNMILMKVHGGTTNKDIIKKVRQAEKTAKKNREQFGTHMYTVLFFDEANTTESIGLIKEIMCDKSMEGERLKLCENLKVVAAVNPYRKHSDELIKKLEQAGLGYHVDADETMDRLGRVPMRRLVYRVQPLPQSLLPLVWDFGQLNTQVEDLYIRQMVRRYVREGKLPDLPNLKETVSAVLTASQEYMRAQKDECSFVSLRDVDRVLTVMSWFYHRSQNERTLYNLIDLKMHGNKGYATSEDSDDDDEDEMYMLRAQKVCNTGDLTRSLILALGVCYHACLKTRSQYRGHVATFFKEPCKLQGGADQIKDEIECCQEVFLDHVHLEKNIARNMALKENVFMMVVCTELRIPLFLVGKPGSSKSLAKTIVSDAMQGTSARENLLKELKQAQMVSFQCSPLSTPDGIVRTFRQCAQFQKDKDLDTFVSVVVLDEVGLAEDSPRMPLKTLHPLLEDGCQGDETPEKHQKVGFIGISNWALDPAKMNRGILVQREVPDLEELKNSASGICRTDDELGSLITPLIEPMAISYLEIFDKASQNMREFYGLRDFYSLVKMVYSFAEKARHQPTWHEMLHAIKRNFGGLDQVEPVENFRKNLATVVHLDTEQLPSDPDNSSSGLIQACLFDTKNESRYLLLLTENYGTLSIIQQQIFSRSNDIHPITIFGSSFRCDQEYTQVCRNINKIKVCMETGNTVVLLNLENLYESLYDALNQYYVYFGGERYVDLGLGTHRVKCHVHKNFRLIVVAEKQTVYRKFPIPLINRLEKHFLTINTLLTEQQQGIVSALEEWAKMFATPRNFGHAHRHDVDFTRIGDVFIGYHDDTCSAIVLDVWEKFQHITDAKERNHQIYQAAKRVLLWCATPDSVVRLEKSGLPNHEQIFWNEEYFQRQKHESVLHYLQHFIGRRKTNNLLVQVTTHSKLLAGVHKKDISQATGISMENILLLEALSSFDTEQQFTNRIQQHMQATDKDPTLMVIQCDSGDLNSNLIACARYCVRDEFEKMKAELRAPVHVVFIIQLPRRAHFNGFQCGVWHSVHIDDLYREDMNMPRLRDMQGKTVAGIFTDAISRPSDKDIIKDLPRASSFSQKMMELANTVSQYMTSDSGTEHERADSEQLHTSAGPSSTLLQLEDVLLELKNVDQQTEDGHIQSGVRHNYLKGLILNCVQGALSMVKDKDETGRETKRVSLVLKLMRLEGDAGQTSFLHGVCCLIAKLLQEKETKTHTAESARHWLMNEAASNESINKAGTFRRSCLQTLAYKVSPILAGIIAYLDTNNNLSILEEKHSPWKQKLWLLFLKNTDALNLQFSDLQSPKKRTDLQEVLVITTGRDGHKFNAKMPFSWIMTNQIAEILRIQNFNGGENERNRGESESKAKVDLILRILSKHPIEKLLSSLTEQYEVIEAMQEYTHDFVHTMYHATSVEEQQLVVQSLHDVSTRHGEDISLLQGMVHVHLAFDTLATRLTYFREINSVWPECSSVFLQLKEKNPDHFIFRDQDFTVSALCLLIENLTPRGMDLNNPNGRSKWLSNVHRCRPVIEKVLNLHKETMQQFEEQRFNSARKARSLWSRVMVVKLFLEHVCTEERDDQITIKHCMPLWALLGDETDMKGIKSFIGVEKFLKSCNRQAMKEYLGFEEKCIQCETVLEGPPITLPCKDVICDQCYDVMRALGENSCAKCSKQFADDWKPDHQASNQNKMDKLKDYQRRCNTFFMDFVSQLCFADNTSPSDEVISKLLGYIFFTTRTQQQRTRTLTIFETGLDPNPVFRSFLLQLLIRTSEKNVMENLRRYLKQAEGYISPEAANQTQQYVELSLLVIQCLEDMLTQEAHRAIPNDLQFTTQALKRASLSVIGEELTVEKLYGLASARMALGIVAKNIADLVLNRTESSEVNRNVWDMIEEARKLCEGTHMKWCKTYLIKCICRCYGIEIYQRICRSSASYLQWMKINNIQREVIEVSDRYIVCGESYTSLREAVTKVVLGEDIEHLKETVQELKAKGVRVEPMLQLAFHREVTFSNYYPERQRKATTQILQTMDHFIQTCETVRNKNFLRCIVHNQVLPRQLQVKEGEDLLTQGIQCLTIHFLIVMTNVEGENTLLQPLIELIKQPQNIQKAFLPTMPQDDKEDLKEALLAARFIVAGADINPVFYVCPNGHLYQIGDCGRPSVVSRCWCGAEIGGVNHNLLPSNRLDAGVDTTRRGHILGRAITRPRTAAPERELIPVYCSAVRLLLHMAMFAGTSSNIQSIQNLITPNIMTNEVVNFIWEHIIRDVENLQDSMHLSDDDVLLVMHSVLDSILRKHNQGKNVRAEVSQWNSKASRREWETAFSMKFLQPVFQDLSNDLKKHNEHLAQDKRLGADPLLCLLYETETSAETENPSMIEQIPRVWRFRTPISMQHLHHEVQTQVGPNQHKVLRSFLKEESKLRALRYIPSIMRLHRALIQKYQRKLDKAEASQITVGHLKKDEIAGRETNQLLQDYADAWELTRQYLTHYSCWTEAGPANVPKEYCNKSITERTPITWLLPATKEAGLCSYALLHFLMGKQNMFLDMYLMETHRKSSSISVVKPTDVTSAHLICYDPQQDILPIVFANCQYSFEMGKGTKVEYDFAGIERQLMDRFLFSKSIIDVGKLLKIDLMVYRTEFTNAEVFRKLADKIPQINLTAVEKAQISTEFRSLPDLCQSLDNLDITISFLKSTGGSPDRRLHDFMLETLQMNSSIESQKAQQTCEFRHAQSLWLLLSHEKAKMMTTSRQNSKLTFESVPSEFHIELTGELFVEFKNYAMKKLSVDNLTQLVEVLHEFIVLIVSIRQDPDDEDYIDTERNRLGEWLAEYVDRFEHPPLNSVILTDFPKDILYMHSVHTWVSAYSLLREKQTGYSRR